MTTLVMVQAKRPHSGKFCYGKTLMQTFKDSIPLAKEKLIDSSKLIFENNAGLSGGTTSFKKVVETEKSVMISNQNFNNFEHNLKDSK